MNQKFETTHQAIQKKHGRELPESILLYPGIELTYLEFSADTLSFRHEPLAHIVQINYCRSGRMGWKMGNGIDIYLGPGDFSIHTLKSCADSIMTFPSGSYDGLVISIDLKEAAKNPPVLLTDSGISLEALRDKFCKNGNFTSLSGDTQTEAIFSCFYNQPKAVMLPYQRVKTLELLLFLTKLEPVPGAHITEYRSQQVNLIHEIHDYLLENMAQRITIRDLSKKYLMNPTTLKDTFKSVYGVSIASHIKEHRMAYAAKMLRESDMSISEIAQNVGYDSQSRFSDAFKAYFHVLPTEYRRQQRPYLPSQLQQPDI